MTRCAAAMRAGKSGKNGGDLGCHTKPRVGCVARYRGLPPAPAARSTAARARSASIRSIAGGTISAITRAPWLPPKTSKLKVAVSRMRRKAT